MAYYHNHPFPTLFNDSYDIDRINDRHRLPDRDREFNHGQLARRNAWSNSLDFDIPRQVFQPRMDIHEDSETNMMTATFELPGMRKENVQIELSDNHETLVVSGEMTVGKEVKEQGFVHRERQMGRFARSVRVPAGTTEADIKASMENEVLKVTFPKASAEQAHRRITID